MSYYIALFIFFYSCMGWPTLTPLNWPNHVFSVILLGGDDLRLERCFKWSILDLDPPSRYLGNFGRPVTLWAHYSPRHISKPQGRSSHQNLNPMETHFIYWFSNYNPKVSTIFSIIFYVFRGVLPCLLWLVPVLEGHFTSNFWPRYKDFHAFK